MILLEARPCAGESDAEIVAGAWDFDGINDLYECHSRVLERLPREPLTSEASARRMQRWLTEERLAWGQVMRLDPLLPRGLHPAGYRGVKAWKQRLKIMAEAGRRLRSFQTGS